MNFGGFQIVYATGISQIDCLNIWYDEGLTQVNVHQNNIILLN